MITFIEKCICDTQNIIYSWDQNLLSFYASHFSRKGELVFLIYLNRNKLLENSSSTEYRERLKELLQSINKFKDENEDMKGVKIIISDSDHSLSAFKILTNKNTEMELRLYSYDTFYNITNRNLVSRYDEEVENKVENPEDFVFLKSGLSSQINWKESTKESWKIITDFCTKSMALIDKGINDK